MIVGHVGPPTARTGGPAGYLHQLRGAASFDRRARHDVRFPDAAAGVRQPRPSTPSNAIGPLTRLRRKLFGPKFYRPSTADLAKRGGVVDGLMRNTAADLRADAKPSLDAALANADVVFTHEPFAAEDALAQRRPGQQVWMMCHAVMPLGLYAGWSWALPEADWPSVMQFSDVRAWIDWERDVWSRVDRFILPCAEAADSFRIVDTRLNGVLDRASYVLSGAAAPAPPQGQRFDRAAFFGDLDRATRVGLYLGQPEPYRGFDALVEAVASLPADSRVAIAVAGPDRSKVPTHPAFRPLGRVEDVGALLASVDFLLNVNRFSLFDLSTIEAVEAGKPLLLHAIGGNRTFEKLGAGCAMLDDLSPATIADGLEGMASLDSPSLAALGRASRACWERELTPARMWERHLALYDRAAAAV